MSKKKGETLKQYRSRRGKGNKWKSKDPVEYHLKKLRNRLKQY
jgi:hypothetical protein